MYMPINIYGCVYFVGVNYIYSFGGTKEPLQKSHKK